MEYQRKELPDKLKTIGMILSGAGLLIVLLAYIVDAKRGAFNNLWFLMFLSSITVGSVILIALEYLAGAVWSVPMRRVTEFIASALPFVIILAIPIFINTHGLYHWSHQEVVEADEILKSKSSYLNVPFMVIRFIIVIGLFILFYWLFTRNSQRQDASGDQRLTKTNVKLSAVFMPIVVIGLSIFAIDFMMSLEPHWFSTIFGIYYLTGTILAGLAATTFAVVSLNERGYFTPVLSGDHYYSLGALMFAFTNFWAYIAFSQFLLIWYANMPEETFWFLSRWENNWKWVSVGLIIIRFAVPYAALLSQPSKMNGRRLKIMAIWILFSHAFDLYWLIMPTFSNVAVFSWYELGFPLLVVGILILAFYFKFKKHNLLPVGDPKLERGLNFHL